MKHTPGPWTIDWNVSRLDVFSSDAATHVATLRRSALSADVDATARANARLIAVAPELLSALRDLVDVMTGRMEGETVALHNALAAIAKAEAGNG